MHAVSGKAIQMFGMETSSLVWRRHRKEDIQWCVLDWTFLTWWDYVVIVIRFLLVQHILWWLLSSTQVVVCVVRCVKQHSMLYVQFWRAAACWQVKMLQNIIQLPHMSLNIWFSRLRVGHPPPHCTLLAWWRKSLLHFQNHSWRYTYICSL